MLVALFEILLFITVVSGVILSSDNVIQYQAKQRYTSYKTELNFDFSELKTEFVWSIASFISDHLSFVSCDASPKSVKS